MNAKKKSTDLCGPDITSWFIEEMNRHIKLFSSYDAGDFYKLVIFARYAKRLAYKYLRFKAGNCPGKNCTGTVTLCGSCIHVSELGNIMFGAVGKVWLGTEPLLIACGVRAGKGSATGGINSVEDMASAVAGLQIVRIFRERDDRSRDGTRRGITAAGTDRCLRESARRPGR